MMVCDSDSGMAGAAREPSDAPGATSPIRAASPATVTHAGFDCGCGSCHAASPTHWITVPARSPVAAGAHVEPIELASVSRSPLLPPPELSVS